MKVYLQNTPHSDTHGDDNSHTVLVRRDIATLSLRHTFVDLDNIRAAFLHRLGCSVSSIQPIDDGMGSAAFAVDCTDNARYFLKVQVFSDVSSVSREWVYLSYAKIRPLHIPVPTPVLLDTSGDYVPFPYMVSSWCEGRTIMSDLAANSMFPLNSILGQIASAFRAMHDMTDGCTGYGNQDQRSLDKRLAGVCRPNDLPEGSRSYCIESIKMSLLQYCQRALEQRVISPETAQNIQTLSEAFEQLPSTTCLLHGDPSLRNFMTKDAQLTAILDGSGKIGPRVEELAALLTFLHDLVWLDCRTPPLLVFQHFLKSYGNISWSIPDDTFFRIAVCHKFLSRLLTCVQVGSHDRLKTYRIGLMSYLSNPHTLSECMNAYIQ